VQNLPGHGRSLGTLETCQLYNPGCYAAAMIAPRPESG
jgi:hypothetical protein